ncbi:hypothetical protein GUJ93_ZPchr0179g33511 [Zizania palustris]|uniref:Uncharacterized protein n=1 Tax=Zizania palustris TaxID=103762 RepID=A0A8J5VRE0_ZIZPA|nr:hypothetical protein GUJ93_ZPchr0179g33511 [Zizania palustris]
MICHYKGLGAAWNTANVSKGSTVAIFGLGAIGPAIVVRLLTNWYQSFLMEREIRINARLDLLLKKMDEADEMEKMNRADLRAMRLTMERTLLKMKVPEAKKMELEKMAEPDQEEEGSIPPPSPATLAISLAPHPPPSCRSLLPSSASSTTEPSSEIALSIDYYTAANHDSLLRRLLPQYAKPQSPCRAAWPRRATRRLLRTLSSVSRVVHPDCG